MERFKRRRPRFLNLAFFKEKDGRFEAFFTYPEDLLAEGPGPQRPAGQVQVGLFSRPAASSTTACSSAQDGYATLILETLDQATFDAMPPIGDFKVLFMGAGGNAVSSASTKEMTVRLDAKDCAAFEKYHFPFPFTFRYWDFDELKDGKPVLKFNMFLLINDYSKILQKLKTSDRTAILQDQIKALEKEIQAGGEPDGAHDQEPAAGRTAEGTAGPAAKATARPRSFPSPRWCASCSPCSAFSSSSPSSSASAWCASSPAP